jgi:hypothetical protein
MKFNPGNVPYLLLKEEELKKGVFAYERFEDSMYFRDNLEYSSLSVSGLLEISHTACFVVHWQPPGQIHRQEDNIRINLDQYNCNGYGFLFRMIIYNRSILNKPVTEYDLPLQMLKRTNIGGLDVGYLAFILDPDRNRLDRLISPYIQENDRYFLSIAECLDIYRQDYISNGYTNTNIVKMLDLMIQNNYNPFQPLVDMYGLGQLVLPDTICNIPV